MLDISNNYNEEELLKALFSVQKFEYNANLGLYNNFSIEEIHLISNYYLNNNLILKALKILNIGIEIHPFDIDLYIKKADILIYDHKGSNKAEIVNILDKIEAYDPNDCRMYLLKAKYYQNMGMYEKALLVLNIALKLSVDKDIIYIDIANIYFAADNYNKAIYYVKNALSYNINNEDAPIMLQEIYAKINATSEAKTFLEKFISDSNPYSFASWFALGYNYTCLNEHNKALVCYDYALAINSEYLEATLYKINSLIHLNKNNDALEILASIDKYINVIDDYELALIANYYKMLDNIKKSRHYYRKLLSNNKNNASALFGMSLTYIDHDYKSALKYLKKACNIDPDNTSYLLTLANTESEIGNIEDAQNIYSQLILKEPENAEIWVEYLEFLYDKQNINKNIDKMLIIANKALEYNKDSCKLFYILARLLFISKKYVQAEYYLYKAVNIDNSYINIFLEKISPRIMKDPELSNVLAKMLKSITDRSSKNNLSFNI